MTWESILPWALTLLCPLSMLWCMRGMRQGQGSCHPKRAMGDPSQRAAVEENRALQTRLAELEMRHAAPSAPATPAA